MGGSGALQGKVTIVLGASARGNVGQAIARTFVEEGAIVTVAGRDVAELERFAAETGATARRCDVTSAEDLRALVEEAKAAHGSLDVAVNCTGRNHFVPFLEVTREELDAVVAVQFVGVYLFLQAVLREASDNASIIQISSLAATKIMRDHAAYMATKAAGDMLVRSAASEFGHRGIRVNGIAPGPILDSPMAAGLLADEAVRARICAGTPLGRIGTTQDVAAAALWLAGGTSFVTGETLQVSGGRALNRLS